MLYQRLARIIRCVNGTRRLKVMQDIEIAPSVRKVNRPYYIDHRSHVVGHGERAVFELRG